MTELQILFRINEMRGKSITLNQSIEVMGRVVFIAEVLESEASEFNMNRLIDDMIDEVMSDEDFN
jgi:hypothetical protein